MKTLLNIENRTDAEFILRLYVFYFLFNCAENIFCNSCCISCNVSSSYLLFRSPGLGFCCEIAVNFV